MCGCKWGRLRRFIWSNLAQGRGTLMKDALRATQQVPGFHDALSIHLVETSPRLRETQTTMLEGRAVSWHDTIAEVPEGPFIVIANELFDALPVHQFEFTGDQWHERLVDVQPDGTGLRLVLDPAAANSKTLGRFARPDDRAIAEVCPAGVAIAEHLAERVGCDTGAALIVDYGHAETGYGDTVQGVQGHATQSIFAGTWDGRPMRPCRLCGAHRGRARRRRNNLGPRTTKYLSIATRPRRAGSGLKQCVAGRCNGNCGGGTPFDPSR